MIESRRKFLQKTACGIGGAALLASLEKFGAINAFAQSAPASDYKALVCIFLFGGNDCNNMIIPYDGYTAYSTVRSNSQLAIPQSVLHQVTPISSGGIKYGFHPNLSPEIANPTQAPGLMTLWQQQKLAVLCNVGTLVQPMTRAQYQTGKGRPYQLFSHSDQTTQQMASISNNPSQTGWGGRIADVTGGLNGSVALPMAISTAGTSIFATGRATTALSVNAAPAALNTLFDLTITGGTAADQTARRAAFSQLLGMDLNQYLVKAASGTTSQAISVDQALATDPVVGAPGFAFPNTSLGNQLKQIAKIIKLKDTLGMKRQVFFCSLGGFDTHSNQTGTNPTSPAGGGTNSGNQGGLLTQLSQAMRAFYEEMAAQGVQNNVTTFTLSDFGRTLQPSGSGATTVGSDHAWGSHALIMGGSVKGTDFYGSFPTLQLGGPDDTDTRGRWIPTTSIDQYAATLGQWYGLQTADLPTVFPFLTRFPTSNLGLLS
jgi:uncharacterized protein (DUF1501 family)